MEQGLGLKESQTYSTLGTKQQKQFCLYVKLEYVP